MRSFLADAVVLLFIVAMYEVTAFYYGFNPYDMDGMVQRRIRDRRRSSYFNRRMYIGEVCDSSDDCHPGLCCVQRIYRTCQPYRWYGQRCSYGQIKGGCYWGHCPCVYGEDVCRGGFCQL
uniref:Putative secreted protein n=1 Tax=Amblyomma aureolatum TaxID=187763 RepID=A0A1E1WXZ4_9ACAR